MAVYVATLSLRTNKVQFLCLTHPRHYAENGLRLLEEGDGVEGSSGFPGSVCLHPLHSPPLSLHSLLSGPPLLPAAGSKARAVWSTRQPTRNIPESATITAAARMDARLSSAP